MAALAVVGLVLLLFAKAAFDTLRTPVVERASVLLPDYPPETPGITIALISDIHVAGPDMPPERLKGIVEQINSLSPDLVLIAGDLVSEKRLATHTYPPSEIVGPLKSIDASLGVVVVPGNHDHWFDFPALSAELSKAGIPVLANQAMQVGPIVLGGLDDDFTGRTDLAKTMRLMDKFVGPRIILSHSPDPFPEVPTQIALFLAGHTHCGQIGYPWGGSPATMSRYGNKYACGLMREDGKTLITTAGLGTSVLPFRLFTHPEIWLIEIGAKEETK